MQRQSAADWSFPIRAACLSYSEKGIFEMMPLNKEYSTPCIDIRFLSVDLFTYRHLVKVHTNLSKNCERCMEKQMYYIFLNIMCMFCLFLYSVFTADAFCVWLSWFYCMLLSEVFFKSIFVILSRNTYSLIMHLAVCPLLTEYLCVWYYFKLFIIPLLSVL